MSIVFRERVFRNFKRVEVRNSFSVSFSIVQEKSGLFGGILNIRGSYSHTMRIKAEDWIDVVFEAKRITDWLANASNRTEAKNILRSVDGNQDDSK